MSGYRTKADHIRALLREGKTKGEAARAAGASYTQVHGLWKQMTHAQQGASIKAAIKALEGKPFTPGDRVIHHRQTHPYLFGVVIQSDPFTTIVRYPGPKQLKYPAYLRTVDLIKAPAQRR